MTILPDLRQPFTVFFQHTRHPEETWVDTIYAMSRSDVHDFLTRAYGHDRITIINIEEARAVS
jgi:predicted Zn-dependent peptidase